MQCKGKHQEEQTDERQDRCSRDDCKHQKPVNHKVCLRCSRKHGVCQVCLKPLTATALAANSVL